MKRSLFLLIIPLLTALYACRSSHDDIVELLDTADSELIAGNPAAALRAANSILDGDTAKLSATDFSRMAIIYMQVSEMTDDLAEVGPALRCFRDAMARDRQEAQNYFLSLPVEKYRYAQALASLTSALDNPEDFDPFVDSDSIPDSLNTPLTDGLERIP